MKFEKEPAADRISRMCRDADAASRMAALIACDEPDVHVWVIVEGVNCSAPLKLVQAFLNEVNGHFQKQMGEVGAVIPE